VSIGVDTVMPMYLNPYFLPPHPMFGTRGSQNNKHLKLSIKSTNIYIDLIKITLSINREAAEGAAVRRGPKDKRRPSAPSEGQIRHKNGT